ncbi:1-aminocyclopropane-1-carboxylate deaminase/D-cysteine desulfhydrase, PLP-dependent ACC family [Soonwooa buanensis]|uniref:1-aminocyclopropane-1-carboxylate deaminase/D-cysteine desulfhydrase, PLP-dependent ACC family n=1 Tax=Soonwooa buanensis TaxID=619805 RepID=A0A1T5DKD6_9FLAO|nr:pyridoxal-phosphate dependent enzyme [Soonwooa buanensis]SKB72172.1 1-aminocyclopropane-1-carboxylate deaminase/D-cysteine desulfhydrase, PLP-dependent ACC family [Soonwooa buanensis]
MLTTEHNIPIEKIGNFNGVELWIKREDLIHPDISGNKYWKLFYNVKYYLDQNPSNAKLITFGGAFSNHIAAVAALGKSLNISNLGIIRGEELKDKIYDNPTLHQAFNNGMEFNFVSRESYRDKSFLNQTLKQNFPEALIIPEGGSNNLAVEGVQWMLNEHTKDFDYLCTAVGTGGTIAGISKVAEPHQKVIGIKVVQDDSLENLVKNWSGQSNFELLNALEARYGKITDDNIRFINDFYKRYQIPLDPIYTGKMMQKLIQLIDDNYFEKGTKILAFHTGGLQAIAGANQQLQKKNKTLIQF